MAADMGHVDSLVAEYLLFRGFTKALRAFQEDSKEDQLENLNSDRIVQRLWSFIEADDPKGLLALWKFLSDALFRRLGPKHRAVVQQLAVSVKRLYVVHQIQSGNMESVPKFFAVYASDLEQESATNPVDLDWRPWFSLPYIDTPWADRQFSLFFTPEWKSSVLSSLRGLVGTVLQHIPRPALLQYDQMKLQLEEFATRERAATAESKRLGEEVRALSAQLRQLQEREASYRHALTATNLLNGDAFLGLYERRRHVPDTNASAPAIRLHEPPTARARTNPGLQFRSGSQPASARSLFGDDLDPAVPPVEALSGANSGARGAPFRAAGGADSTTAHPSRATGLSETLELDSSGTFRSPLESRRLHAGSQSPRSPPDAVVEGSGRFVIRHRGSGTESHPKGQQPVAVSPAGPLHDARRHGGFHARQAGGRAQPQSQPQKPPSTPRSPGGGASSPASADSQRSGSVGVSGLGLGHRPGPQHGSRSKVGPVTSRQPAPSRASAPDVCQELTNSGF